MTDEELMRAVCNGDQSAYQAIVKQHLKSISHYAFRILGNKKDTEDITQETFLKLWINAEKWRPEKAKLSTWLHRITHNLCVDYLRKHGNTQIKDNIEEEKQNHTEWQHSYEVSDHRKKQEQLLKEAIDKLPENQRSALMLCHYSGFSNKEAAAIMDVSVKALESAIARAKRSLRKQLSNVNSEETTASSELEKH
ncbi:MAG: sigma-70 family RNA polymerase sigma factor [Pseudomonadales bacterium]|nr:sigma-70 family RNA polymerase sigma factor [Pseudomonadales bacterium]